MKRIRKSNWDTDRVAVESLNYRTQMIIVYFLFVIIFFLVCASVILFFIAQIIAAFQIDAPFVPVPVEIEDKIIEILKLNSNSVFYDLGCGDARVILKALDKYPDIKAVGVEVAFFPYLLARFYIRKYKNAEIRQEDIFKTDLSDASHIFMYLFPGIPGRLMPILEKKCKVGTKVVSCDFDDNSREATEIIELNPLAKRGKRLIVYTI